MPVYDIAANQVLAKPVSNFYQGKAMRLALESEKLKNQVMEQEIEAAPDIRAREQQEADANLLKAQTEYAKAIREMEDAQREEQVRELTGAYSVYQDAMSETEDPEQAEQAAVAYVQSQGGSEEEVAGIQDGARSVGGMGRFLKAMISEAENVLGSNKGEAVNVMLPGGERQSAIETEEGILIDPETRKPLPKGTTEVSQQITTDNPGDLTPSQHGKRVSEAMDSYEGSNNINEAITNVLPKIIENPGVAGTSGKFAEFVGAGATFLMGKEAGDLAAEYFSGMDQEQLAKIRTQMQTLRARLRPIVTGEEGARQSESERQLANQAIGHIDSIQSVTDLAQAYPKVIGSLKQLMVESYVNQYQKATTHESIEVPFDLTTDDGLDQFMEKMAVAGMDEDTAVEAFKRLKKIQVGK